MKEDIRDSLPKKPRKIFWTWERRQKVKYFFQEILAGIIILIYVAIVSLPFLAVAALIKYLLN